MYYIYNIVFNNHNHRRRPLLEEAQAPNPTQGVVVCQSLCCCTDNPRLLDNMTACVSVLCLHRNQDASRNNHPESRVVLFSMLFLRTADISHQVALLGRSRYQSWKDDEGDDETYG